MFIADVISSFFCCGSTFSFNIVESSPDAWEVIMSLACAKGIVFKNEALNELFDGGVGAVEGTFELIFVCLWWKNISSTKNSIIIVSNNH
jgi:hypothetical protein